MDLSVQLVGQISQFFFLCAGLRGSWYFGRVVTRSGWLSGSIYFGRTCMQRRRESEQLATRSWWWSESEVVAHSHTWRVMSYGWPPGSDTCRVWVTKAADACGGVGNAGELHGALRDRKCEGKAVGFWGKVWLKYFKVLKVDTWYYIVKVCERPRNGG